MEDKEVRKAKSRVRERRQEHLNEKAQAGSALRDLGSPKAAEAPEGEAQKTAARGVRM